MGIVNLVSAATPPLAARVALLRKYSPLEVRLGGHLTAAIAGAALIYLSAGLWRRKTVAWHLTVAVLLVSSASHIVKGLDYEEASLAGGLAFWLLLLRNEFRARSDSPSINQGTRALVTALVVSLGYGTAGFYLLDRHFSVRFTLFAALRQTLAMFAAFYDPGLEPISGFGRYFADSIYVLSATAVGFSLWLLMRPVLVRQPATRAERNRAREIVERYGHTSVARFTLFPDKSYYFGPGDSVIAYVVKGRVALALGDVIGPADDVSPTLSRFRELCSLNDWQPAFYQTLPNNLNAYQAAGWSSVCIGHEGVVTLQDFTLAGGSNQTLRSTIHKLEREGYKTTVQAPPLTDGCLRGLRAISDEWLALVHGAEKSFSLGSFDDEYIRSSQVMVVLNPAGHPVAFANIVPEYRAKECAIDLMRHHPDAASGAMELLLVSLLQWAKEQGFETFNLGLSALSGVGERPDDAAIERAMHFAYQHVNQFYSFRGLHAFKAKFHPTWSPRYLVYPGAAVLPEVATALVRADSGDRFVVDYVQDLTKRFRASRRRPGKSAPAPEARQR
jgi:phosphatidylglycerol lysyltransferase